MNSNANLLHPRTYTTLSFQHLTLKTFDCTKTSPCKYFIPSAILRKVVQNNVQVHSKQIFLSIVHKCFCNLFREMRLIERNVHFSIKRIAKTHQKGRTVVRPS